MNPRVCQAAASTFFVSVAHVAARLLEYLKPRRAIRRQADLLSHQADVRYRETR
jgi:hypothetical protein